MSLNGCVEASFSRQMGECGRSVHLRLTSPHRVQVDPEGLQGPWGAWASGSETCTGISCGPLVSARPWDKLPAFCMSSLNQCLQNAGIFSEGLFVLPLIPSSLEMLNREELLFYRQGLVSSHKSWYELTLYTPQTWWDFSWKIMSQVGIPWSRWHRPLWQLRTMGTGWWLLNGARPDSLTNLEAQQEKPPCCWSEGRPRGVSRDKKQ